MRLSRSAELMAACAALAAMLVSGFGQKGDANAAAAAMGPMPVQVKPLRPLRLIPPNTFR
jgi:hypothetical protein